MNFAQRLAPPLAAAALASLLGFSLARAAPPAQDIAPAQDSAAQVMDEVVVTGARAGPGMWHVSRGNAQLWVLGSLSPLPQGITWRSQQVESVLDFTTQVLVQKPLDIGIARVLWLFITERSLLMAHGGKLKDVLPAGLYARFAALRAKYSDDPRKWERYRPIIAAAFLQQAAFHRVGLSTRLDLGAAVRILAKKHHVRIEEVKIAGVSDVLEALKNLPPGAENTCVEGSLATTESGLPRLVERAQAWASGNVERLQALPEPPGIDACRAALDAGVGAADLIALAGRTWLDTLLKYLQRGGVTLAVVNIDLLLGRGGLLDQLHARGYDVVAQ